MRPWRWVRQPLLYVVAAATCVVIAFPIYWMTVSSLEPGNLFNFPPHFWPSQPDLATFVRIFQVNPLDRWLLNSLLVAGGTMLISMALSVHAAYAMSRYRNGSIDAAGFLILIGQMVPVTVLTIPFYVLFRAWHLIDTLTGIVIATTTFTIPMCLWMLRGFFQQVPRDLDEAARIDGCTPLRTLYAVIFPASLPGLVSTAAFAFMLGWNEFFFASTFLSSTSKWVATVGLVNYVTQYYVQWSELMATALVITAVPAVLFLSMQRYMTAGITQGAVKG